MKLYKFKKYKRSFPEKFKEEKIRLQEFLPKAKIEHIGSTSIKGLGGKGVIDILLGVNKKDLKKAKNILVKNHYIYKNSLENRYFFIKEKGFFMKKRYHLHLTTNNSIIWKKAIKFRDYLRKNKQASQDYLILKKHAYILCKENSKCYHKFKENFIKDIIKKKGT